MRVTAAERSAWLVGLVGLLGCAVAGALNPAQLPYAWLAAVTCFLAWPLGSLALVFIHVLTGGRWGYAIRPQLTAGIATLPLLIPALLPLPFVAHALYPWMQPQVAAHLNNRFYLNAPFFYCRAVLYLAIWLTLGYLATRELRRADPQPGLASLAPAALILLGLTVTFAAIDSTLSLDPQFKSSIYGMLVCVEAVLFALSVALLGVAAAPAEVTRVLGRLLLALVVLWAYLDFMQFLIVWNSNLPDEAGWYVHRLQGGWAPLAIGIAVLHFGLPLFALLSPAVQRSRSGIGTVAALLVVLEIPRAWWIVIPASGRGIAWSDAAAMFALLGLAAGLALRAFRSAPREARAHG
jgi:hypothetical protein